MLVTQRYLLWFYHLQNHLVLSFITESGVQCNILHSFSSDKRVMFEPWMLRTIEDEPGTVDFKLREKVECGDSIMNRNKIGLLDTLMEAKLQDF